MAMDRIPCTFVGCIHCSDPYATRHISNQWVVLSFVPAVITLAYAAQEEVDHATQNSQIPYLMGCVMLIVESLIVGAAYFTGGVRRFTPFIILYSLAMVALIDEQRNVQVYGEDGGN